MTILLLFAFIFLLGLNERVKAQCFADFISFPDSVPNPTLFDGTTSTGGVGPIVKWIWDFGDGSPIDSLSGPLPNHPYTDTGTYQVCLIVIDTVSPGCTDTFCDFVYVPGDGGPPPCFANFSSFPDTVPNSIQFNDLSSPGVIEWIWDFGDGSPIDSLSGPNPTHIYPDTVSYWVCLTINDSVCTNSFCDWVYPSAGPPPSCFANFSSFSDTVPNSIQFNDFSSPGVIQWVWDFGDSSLIDSTSGPNPTHIYPDTVPYWACLTISDGVCTNSWCDWVYPSAGPPPSCYAMFGYSQDTVPEQIQFFDMSSPEVTSWIWDFGDGVIDTTFAPTITHTYPGTGMYFVCLTIKDSFCMEVFCDSIYVSAAPPVCKAAVRYEQDSMSYGIQFYDISTPGVMDRFWSFGDGTIDTINPDPWHLYASPGTYVACLSIMDNTQCFDTWCDTIIVREYFIVAGTVLNFFGDTIRNGKVRMFRYSPQPRPFDLGYVANITSNGYYEFNFVYTDDYVLRAERDTMDYPDAFNTYFESTTRWFEASIVTVITDTFSIDIIVQTADTVPGPGTIRGIVKRGNFAGKVAGSGDPFDDINVTLIKKPANTAVDGTLTDTNGVFEFTNVAQGDYLLHIDVPGIPIDTNFVISITQNDPTTENIEVTVDSNQISFKDVTGISQVMPDQRAGFEIYPNPTSGNFTIALDVQGIKDVKIRLCNIIGQEIFAIELNQFLGKYQKEINLNDHPLGIYLLSGTIGEHFFYEKVIRQ